MEKSYIIPDDQVRPEASGPSAVKYVTDIYLILELVFIVLPLLFFFTYLFFRAYTESIPDLLFLVFPFLPYIAIFFGIMDLKHCDRTSHIRIIRAKMFFVGTIAVAVTITIFIALPSLLYI